MALVSIPAAHVRTDILPPVLPIATNRSRKPRDPIPLSPVATLKSCRGSADVCADEDKVNIMLPTPHPTNSVPGNPPFALFLISLAILIVFFAATWLTVLRDARSMRDQVLSKVTGVSLPLCFNGCVLLTAAAVLGINTRPHHPTRSRCICIVRFVEGRRLRCTHYSRGSTPILCSRSRKLQAVR